MSTQTQRPKLTAPLDPETHARWKAFARANHVTMTGLCEALGRLYLDPSARPPAWLRRLIAEGQAVDDERSP